MDVPPPALALSDILHTMSPSPAPLAHDVPFHNSGVAFTSNADTDSPEPIADEEVSRFRNRLDELGFLNEGNSSSLNPKERELADMVIRLTEPSRPSTSQIVEQATVISELTTQRDFLKQSADEERARWLSEKEGWERSAEALVSQRHRRGHYGTKNEDLERVIAMLQSENAGLRQREYETASRLVALENEMSKLKPLLLLQPFPAGSTPISLAYPSTYLASLPYPASSGAAAFATQRHRLSRKRKREKDKEPEEPEKDDAPPPVPVSINGKAIGENGASTSTLVLAPAPNIHTGPSKPRTSPSPSTSTHPIDTTPPNKPTTPAIYQHLLRFAPTQPQHSTSQPQPFDSPGKTIRNPNPRSDKPDKIKSVRTSSLTSDARTEHLLLAARKIGRERSSVVAGIIEAEQEKAKRKEQQDRETMETGKSATTKYYRNKNDGWHRSESADGLTIVNVSPGTINGTSKHQKKSAAPKPFLYAGNPSAPGVNAQQPAPTLPHAHAAPRKEIAGTASASVAPAAVQRHNPPTPMDSLLDAARSMMGNGEGAVASSSQIMDHARGEEKKRQAAFNDPGVDLPPKKRKISSSSKSLAVAAESAPRDVGRVPSALDVLADQADQVAKGKGKETMREQSVDTTSSTTTKLVKKPRVKSTSTKRRNEDGRQAGSTEPGEEPSMSRGSIPRMIASPGSFSRRGSASRSEAERDPGAMELANAYNVSASHEGFELIADPRSTGTQPNVSRSVGGNLPSLSRRGPNGHQDADAEGETDVEMDVTNSVS
ncbi:hypothetical protein D9758_003528 [Tetrapyrgos nigripes]|uniref:Uncharacterized protein n=1 Tax=Tetrapyrgos nigripes TaxID=182062 RepID=A0A8H5GVE6_9AGAR|nr:hypothetical protein D9758_003528 [Tetrapyrgos nigripes]